VKNIFKKQSNYPLTTIFTLIVIMIFLVILSFGFRELTKEISSLSASIVKIITQEDASDDVVVDDQEPEPTESDDLESEDGVCEFVPLSVKAMGQYYSLEGDQLGVGPLPPVVDIPTNVWIFFEIENFNGNLEKFSLTAQLPENVIWTNKKSVLAGKLNFGQIGKRVVWEVDLIDQKDKVYKAGFEISLIPTQSDLGKVLDLVTDIKFSAVEQSCQSEIDGSLDNITTDLIFDSLASGKGKVIEFLDE